MRLTIYQIDAFASKLFTGNPAAVIPLEKWIPDELMQQIALENNLSETAFLVPSVSGNADFEIRWFTPAVEINLCGHATLASAFVLFNFLDYRQTGIKFSSKSGILSVTKQDDLIVMDFPSWKPERLAEYHSALQEVLGNVEIIGVYQHRDILVELENEKAVAECSPDFTLMRKHFDKMIIAAPGNQADFVSRFFAPGAGIDEDPVTGSAHAQLIPFWAEKLGKNKLYAKQLSQRGGELWCESAGDRVMMSGNCVFYMKGEIFL